MLTNNYKKKDLIKDLSNKTGFSLNYSTKLISDLIETIVNNIGMQNFKIKNIGTFKIINKKKRIGSNPKTNEEHIISARKSISFIPSKNLLKKLNNSI